MNEKDSHFIESFLSLLGESNLIRNNVEEYERNISILLANPELVNMVGPTIIFDVMQSVEGLHVATRTTTQKLLTLISKIPDTKSKDITFDTRVEKTKSVEGKVDSKEKRRKSVNPLINNALEYLDELLDSDSKDKDNLK